MLVICNKGYTCPHKQCYHQELHDRCVHCKSFCNNHNGITDCVDDAQLIKIIRNQKLKKINEGR